MDLRDIIRAKIRELSACKRLEGKRIFLFGYNIYTETVNNSLYEEGYQLYRIIDNDKEKQGRKRCNILIAAPDSIEWGKRDLVLIVSRHREQMIEQMTQLSKDVNIFILSDFNRYIEEIEKKEKFWIEENYELERYQLKQGAEVYHRLKEEEILIVVQGPSIGDMCLGAFHFVEFEKAIYPKKIKLVIASEGIYKTAQLFGIRKVKIISKSEIDSLVKYLLFDRPKEDIICGCVCTLDVMGQYKKMSVPQWWSKFFYRLTGTYELDFPAIWDSALKETEVMEKGLVKGKSVILAPYANTLEELPFQFWELLTKRLLEMNFCVFTNVAGKQKPIKGSLGLEIPLNQIGNYLEFAGYFVSLRNGLCDIAGRSQCKQIIFFRDRLFGKFCSQIEIFDLHAKNVSEHAIQCVYDDTDLFKNIDTVIEALTDGKSS